MDDSVTSLHDWPGTALVDRVHICLVSRQPLPNLMPLFWPKHRPSKLVLFITPDMQDSAALLARFAASRHVRVSSLSLEDSAPMTISNALIDLVERAPETNFILNLTGGTKLMALGALEAAQAADIPVYYMDTDRGTCLRIFPVPFQEVPIPELFRVRDILEAHGYAVLSAQTAPVPADIRTLTRKILMDFGRFSRVIPAFNAMALSASQMPDFLLKRDGWPTSSVFTELLTMFEKAGLLAQDRNTVRFESASACFVAGGGWLEAHVQGALHKLRADGLVYDHASNVVVESSTGVKNELDAVLVFGNRLFVIECKTARMSAEERDEDVSYKLDTLRDVLGGVMGRAMLVSYLPLSEARRKRCQEYHIHVVQGGDIIHLEERITRWISKNIMTPHNFSTTV